MHSKAIPRNYWGCGFCTCGGIESETGSVSTRRVPSAFAESVSRPFSVLLVLQDRVKKLIIKMEYFISTIVKSIMPIKKPVLTHRPRLKPILFGCTWAVDSSFEL
jgi:hypothetical protein